MWSSILANAARLLPFDLEYHMVDDSLARQALERLGLPTDRATLRWLTQGGRCPKHLDHRHMGRLIRRGRLPHTPAKQLLFHEQVDFKNCILTSRTTKSSSRGTMHDPEEPG